MYVTIIAGTVLISSFLWMSNSIKNRPPVVSRSWFQFIKKLLYRHRVAIPLIGVMLVLIPIQFKLLGIAIDLLFIGLEVLWAYKIITHRQERYQYVKSLNPKYKCYYSKIRLNPDDNRKLGGQNLHYMFICPKTGLITFPESKYGNRRRYRLIEVHFKPKYGPNYLRLTYSGKDYTRESLFHNNAIDRAYRDKIAEIPSNATVTLESKDVNWPITIRLRDEIHGKIRRFKRDCLFHLNHHHHHNLSSGVA